MGKPTGKETYKRFDVVAYDAMGNRVETVQIFSLEEAMRQRDLFAAVYPRAAVWCGRFTRVFYGEDRALRPRKPRRAIPTIEAGRSYVGAKPRYDHLGRVEFRTVTEVRRRPGGLPTRVCWTGNATFTAETDGVADCSFEDFRDWVGDYYIPEPQAAPLRARMAP